VDKIEELRTRMKRISQYEYCAGWLVDLEFFIWQYAHDPNSEWYKTYNLTYLIELAKEISGWWVADKEQNFKKVFISLEEWTEKYKNWTTRQGTIV